MKVYEVATEVVVKYYTNKKDADRLYQMLVRDGELSDWKEHPDAAKLLNQKEDDIQSLWQIFRRLAAELDNAGVPLPKDVEKRAKELGYGM